MEIISFVLAILAGSFAGFIGSSVGGGGLISIPALIFLGLPPVTAIATSKLGAVGMGISSCYKYNKEKKVNWKLVPPLFFIYLIGAFIGSSFVLTIDESILTKAVGVILLLVLLLIIFKPEIGVKKQKPKHKKIGYLLLALIGFWAGFFGGGYGIMAGYVLTIFFGLSFIEMTGTDLMASWGIMLSSLAVFAFNGVIDYGLGIAIGIGFFLGGYAGSAFAIKKGNAWVRLLFIVFVVISAIKLLFF